MKRLITYISSLLMVLALSCKNDPCFKGSGESVSERRELKNDISMISVYDNIRLNIYIDSVNYIEVKGGENLVAYISTEISGKELILKNDNKCSFLRDFDQDFYLDLHVKDFSKIHYDGSGDITMRDTLIRNDFTLEMESGAGNLKLLIRADEFTRVNCAESFSEIKLYGSSPVLFLYSDGTAWIRGEQFSTAETYVENKSTGDCIVNVSDVLQCTLKGIGNIRYHGNPVVSVLEKSGKGSIIQEK